MPRKIIFALASLSFCANSNPFLDYKQQNIDFDLVSTSLTGFSAGYSWKENRKFYVQLDVLSDSENKIDFYDLAAGYNHNLYTKGDFSATFNVGIGIGSLDFDKFENTNVLMSLPIGLMGTYSINKNWFIDMKLGYTYFIDLTSPTECNDGTESDSTGSGTCSYHGGISRYQDQIGNGSGVNYGIGLRYQFDQN